MTRVVVSSLLWLSLATATGLAQPPDSGPASGLERELAGIRVTLQDIAQLLRQQLEASNRDVVLRQIEIKNARLVPIEQELRSIRTQIEGQETELERLESRAQELQETAFYSENEEEQQQARRELKELESFAEQLRSAIAKAQARELETLRRIDEIEAEIATLEQRLD